MAMGKVAAAPWEGGAAAPWPVRRAEGWSEDGGGAQRRPARRAEDGRRRRSSRLGGCRLAPGGCGLRVAAWPGGWGRVGRVRVRLFLVGRWAGVGWGLGRVREDLELRLFSVLRFFRFGLFGFV